MLNNYIAIDVETTGLDPKNDELIEIAAIKFEDGQVVDEFVTLLCPNNGIPEKIKQLTGINNAMVAMAPSFPEIASDLIRFCSGSLIVCHNAKFDMGFIYENLGQLGFDFPNKVACTLELAREKLNLDSNKLENVGNYFGVDVSDLHRAKADAVICGEIFHYLKDIDISDSAPHALGVASSDTLCPPRNDVGSVQDNIWTVSQLNGYIKNLFDGDMNLINISVTAEISNFKKNLSGHLYLTLKDEKCAINAVMFKSAAGHLKFEPENGMKVIANGRVSIYEVSGQYQLYIENLTVSGVGDLAVAYEQLKNKLEAFGYFSDEHKKAIPNFPKKIGVVTSATGSVIRDIINVATRRFPCCEIILFPSKVQGDGAADEIVAGIEYFNTRDDIDTLIIGRGGGSIEDLWCFNEEKVAEAIFKSRLPIISAIGHETDFTIADFVADLRAPTPSAAAEIAVPSSVEIREKLGKLYKQSLFALRTNIERKRELIAKFAVKAPSDVINMYRMRLDGLFDKILVLTNHKIIDSKADLNAKMSKLDALSPLKVLERGFAVVKNSEGVAVKSVGDVKSGDKVGIRFADGEVGAVIDKEAK